MTLYMIVSGDRERLDLTQFLTFLLHHRANNPLVDSFTVLISSGYKARLHDDNIHSQRLVYSNLLQPEHSELVYRKGREANYLLHCHYPH